jgi:hypothetical protein
VQGCDHARWLSDAFDHELSVAVTDLVSVPLPVALQQAARVRAHMLESAGFDTGRSSCRVSPSAADSRGPVLRIRP